MNIKSKMKLSALALCVGISGVASATPSANFDKTNNVVKTVNSLAESQAFADNDSDISYSKRIMQDSTSYANDLALKKKSKDIYKVLVNTKNQALQKAQIEVLVDIDQQLRLLNSKIK